MTAATVRIVHEDAALLAVDKPAGLLVHRSAIAADETDFLLGRLQAQVGGTLYLAHRLDRATSGLVLLAKTREIAGLLGRQFMERSVTKRYLAIVRGWPESEGTIDYALPAALGRPRPPRHLGSCPAAALGRPRPPRHLGSCPAAALGRPRPPRHLGSCPADVREHGPRKPALTRWRVLATATVPIAIGKYPEQRYALIEASPETGRYRQLRKHFHHVSHHIVGDTSHGRGDHNRLWRVHFGVHRLMLHAWRLELVHPLTQAPLLLAAPPDADWVRVLDRFGWRDAVGGAAPASC